jgi:tRNA-dihydrouridine synthase B
VVHRDIQSTLSSNNATPSNLAKPFYIGDICVNPPVILAPMADVTNGAFRRICAKIGKPGLLCTEQISTMALHHASERTRKMFDWTNAERPLSLQLFGSDPAIMSEAARISEERGADIIDINMGCWVPKVCRQGAGAALLKDHSVAIRVVKAVVEAVKVPVTVKMRAGWSQDLLNSPELAKELEQLGVRAFTLHARTAQQGFDGDADWSLIRRIKEAVNAPVIGNGDIRLPQDARRMMLETGCDGVMVGRAAIGNPWILRDIAHYLAVGELLPPPTLSERKQAALEHLRDLAELYGEECAVRHLRAQLPRYFKGLPGAVHLRMDVMTALTISRIEEILNTVLSDSRTRNHETEETGYPAFQAANRFAD